MYSSSPEIAADLYHLSFGFIRISCSFSFPLRIAYAYVCSNGIYSPETFGFVRTLVAASVKAGNPSRSISPILKLPICAPRSSIRCFLICSQEIASKLTMPCSYNIGIWDFINGNPCTLCKCFGGEIYR